MRPLLKWAGGKRSLIKKITQLFPHDYKKRSYHEPFLGGGAVFFEVEANRGSINDINHRLMNFYRVVASHPEELIQETEKYKYNEDEYYKNRERFNSNGANPIESAALFLYLNRTCYNGLYRVNSKGGFNVPFGRYVNPKIVFKSRIRRASSILKRMELRCGDFRYLEEITKEGDLCYLDPPYYPQNETANFTDYSSRGFTDIDHIRLRNLCLELNKRGILFVQSNRDTEFTNELYGEIDYFKIYRLKTTRMISSKVSSRLSGNDILITNIL